MRSRSRFFMSSVFVFFCFFLWAKCKRQFSVPFLSCSCSRVDHVCVFLFSRFEQINDDDDDELVVVVVVVASGSAHVGSTWVATVLPRTPSLSQTTGITSTAT